MTESPTSSRPPFLRNRPSLRWGFARSFSGALTLLLISLCALVPNRATGAAARPNIVFILADDLGWGDVGYHNPQIDTPNLNALAQNGVRLNSHYVLPICSPTRAALMTGIYPMRYGLQNAVVPEKAKNGLPLHYHTLAEDLRSAGYRTSIIGKWHLGRIAGYRPMQRGFDHQYGLLGGQVNYLSHRTPSGRPDWSRDQTLIQEAGYTTELLGQEAVRYIRQAPNNQPYFMLLAFNATHSPLNGAPRRYLERYAASGLTGWRLKLAAAASAMDDQIGNVLDALRQKGALENTLIVFTSDNGGQPRFGGSNTPLKEGKNTHSEGGVRVPTLVSWPGTLAPRVIDEPVHMVDWYPTLCAQAGAAPRQAGLDGLDIWRTLADGAPSPHQELLINVSGWDGALRRGRWKLIFRKGIAELYDVLDDPTEQTNQISALPWVSGPLVERFLEYQTQQATPLYPTSKHD